MVRPLELKTKILNGKNNILVLFRTRAEVLMASSYLWKAEIPHKLRMSGIPNRIHPWIARVFSRFTERYINNEQFENEWIKRCYNPLFRLPLDVQSSLGSINQKFGDI